MMYADMGVLVNHWIFQASDLLFLIILLAQGLDRAAYLAYTKSSIPNGPLVWRPFRLQSPIYLAQ